MSEWLQILQRAVEQRGLREVSTLLRRSKGCISDVLNGKYGASTKRIEERVRGELMNKTLTCPVLGEISPAKCQDEQERPFAATNPTRVAVWKACRAGCPNFRRS